MSVLNTLFGLCAEDIDYVYRLCDDIFEKLGMDDVMDDFDTLVFKKVTVTGRNGIFDWDNPTHCICDCMLSIATDMIVETYGDAIGAEYVENARASHIFIECEDLFISLASRNITIGENIELVKKTLETSVDAFMTWDEIAELFEYKDVLERFISAREAGKSIDVYETLAEFGSEIKGECELSDDLESEEAAEVAMEQSTEDWFYIFESQRIMRVSI